MAIERNYAISLIGTLLSEIDHLDSDYNFTQFHPLASRTKMLANKIFGAESHYLNDLRQIETASPSNRKEGLRHLCKTMLEDLQLDKIAELHAATQSNQSQSDHMEKMKGLIGTGLLTETERDKIVAQSLKELAELRKSAAKWDDESKAIQSERMNYQAELASLRMELNNLKSETYSERGRGSGYIVLDLPEEQKSAFQDLLKGFADYVKVKGYELAFSFDGSVSRRISFKFAFAEGSPEVSQQQVRRDFSEYIDAVEKGEPVVSLPPNSSLEQQHLYLLMSNKIVQLNAQIKMQRNMLMLQDSTIQKLTSGAISIISPQHPMPNPQFLIQSGQANQAVQGSGNTFSGSIHIESTPEGRERQIQALESMKSIVEKHPDAGFISKNISEAQDELKKPTPDPQRMAKVLEPVKYGIKALGLVYEIKQSLGPTWDAIKILLGLDISS